VPTSSLLLGRHPADYFRQVRVDEESRTIVWPNGLDPAPELLHGDSEPVEAVAQRSAA
jgi:hypothetical protein